MSQDTKSASAKSVLLELVPPEDAPLTPQERKALSRYETMVAEGKEKFETGFKEIAEAFHQIRDQRLYRETHHSFAAYFNDKWGYGRSYASEIADDGEIIKRMSARADTLPLLTSPAHFRPIVHLEEKKQDEIMDVVEKWMKWKSEKTITPALIKSAKAFISPAGKPHPPNAVQQKLVKRFEEIVKETKGKLPPGTSPSIRKLFDQLKTKAVALGGPRSSTGISWADHTWNPLQGCTRVSAGCDRCYAAKKIATRMADMYPGLATWKKGADGRKQYLFNGKIVLLPEQLGEPLLDLTPRRYFVNSMSDLFHKDVPDDFIEAVFQVMEKADWHVFQVLTKRPERQAEFTHKYFRDRKPPPNIWLGTTTEDQDSFDKRIPHLRDTRAAVRWLSCEPLLGPIKLDSPAKIDWVVVGGESDSLRPMKKEWATSLRGQCKKARIAFHFKQWGSFDEEGKGPKREKHDPLVPATLDGVIHNAYPRVKK